MKNNSNHLRIILRLCSLFFLVLIIATPALAEDEIFEEYFSNVRPEPQDKPTPVKIGIIVLDVDSIDGATQSFVANFGIVAQWEDPRLAKKTRTVRKMGLDEIWNPGLQILNQQKLFSTFPDTAEISPEGNVIYRQRYWGALSYPMDLKNFPLDHHTLQIKVVSAGYSDDEIEFVLLDDKSGMSDVFTVADWDIVKWQVITDPIQLGPGLPVLSGVKFEFVAKRLVNFYIIKVLVPLVMIIFMSFIILFIDPAHIGPKFSIAITAMLTLIAYRFLLGNLLPKVSYLTRMDYFLFGATFLVFGVLVETAITTRLMSSNRKQFAERIDYWSRWIFIVLFITILVLSFFAWRESVSV